MANGSKLVGRKLKEAREALDLSQDEVGARLNMSGVNYGNFERGKRSINVEYLIQLSMILQMPTSWFLGEETGLSDDEHTLVEAYRDIESASDRSVVLTMVRGLAKK